MARAPKWLEILRKLHLDERALIQRIAQKHGEMVNKFGNGDYHKNDGLFLEDMMALRHEIGKADAVSQASQALMENNSRTAADIEREVLKRHPRKE